MNNLYKPTFPKPSPRIKIKKLLKRFKETCPMYGSIEACNKVKILPGEQWEHNHVIKRKPLARSFIKRAKRKYKFRSPLKKAKDAADTAWSLYIRFRDSGCRIAGLDHLQCKGALQAMHIITRGNHGLRFDELNGLGGCQAHHAYYTYRPAAWQQLMETHFLREWSHVNNLKAMETPHYKEYDYRALEEKYKRLLEVLQ